VVGYCAPAATGAALANKKYAAVRQLQPDGDLMYAPASCDCRAIIEFHC